MPTDQPATAAEQPKRENDYYGEAADIVREAVRSASGFYGELTRSDGSKGAIALVMWLGDHPKRPRCWHPHHRDDCAGCGYRRALKLIQGAVL